MRSKVVAVPPGQLRLLWQLALEARVGEVDCLHVTLEPFSQPHGSEQLASSVTPEWSATRKFFTTHRRDANRLKGRADWVASQQRSLLMTR